METSVSILKYIYKILNRNELTDNITGAIYLLQKPKNSEKEDIVINAIYLKSGHYQDIQNGEANINIYSKNINGQPNTLRLQEISEIVIKLLKDNISSNHLFDYEIIDTHVLSELQQNSLSFLNIKLKIHKY